MSAAEEDMNQQLEDAIAEVEGKEEETVELTAIEKEAAEMGWTSKEEFVENGGDESKWSSAHEYVKYGKLQSAMKDQSAKFDRKAREFDERLENVNKLHQAQLDAKIEELKSQQRTAASEADIDGYDRAQKQIDSLEAQKVPETSGKDPLIAQWEADNPWISDLNDPRTATANGAYINFVNTNPNATSQQAIDYVNSMIEKITPTVTNQRREAAPTTETSGRQTSRRSPRNLSMSDLTVDERFMWSQTGVSMWGGDEEKYLKACADARKGA